MEIGENHGTRIVWRGIIEEYREFLPVSDDTPVITLNEGNTPLIKSKTLKRMLGLDIELYFKFDGANPTGSFKDRGMTLALSKAMEGGAKAVICASTGNTSASAAAYAARAGIRAIVLIPEGKIALGKLAQALVHGAPARDESGGKIDAVTDEEILSAYKLIASAEGIFCEPASAASLAGVIKLYNDGYFRRGSNVVCTLTGNGLKDPDTVFKVSKAPLKVKADVETVERAIEGII